MTTPQLEKTFFNYIRQTKKYFEVVKPYFFNNKEIQYIYEILRDYVLMNPDLPLPSPKQYYDMILNQDKDKNITPDIFKSILKFDLSEYSEVGYIIPNFNKWLLGNRIKAGAVDIVDITRDFENVSDFDKAIESAEKIKRISEDMTSLRFINDDEDLGSDFEDAEAHNQDNSTLKVKSGFDCLDFMLGGGWDVATLNILMGESNNGKSLWMQNLAVKAADVGYNVLYITLEMSEKKVLKRLGSMRLRIPINEYDTLSRDTEYMKKKIKSIRDSGGGDLFEKKVGKIITKFWAAGTSTVSDYDNYLEKLKDKKGIKIDLIIVDYITLIASPKGQGGDTLYTKGKFLAEGLRAIAAKYNVPVVTAVQLSKDAWGASDLTLESVPESKAIVETADTFFGIIRTPEMKKQNLYRFKMLKQRDGDFSRPMFRCELDSKYLTLENDNFVD